MLGRDSKYVLYKIGILMHTLLDCDVNEFPAIDVDLFDGEVIVTDFTHDEENIKVLASGEKLPNDVELAKLTYRGHELTVDYVPKRGYTYNLRLKGETAKSEIGAIYTKNILHMPWYMLTTCVTSYKEDIVWTSNEYITGHQDTSLVIELSESETQELSEAMHDVDVQGLYADMCNCIRGILKEKDILIFDDFVSTGMQWLKEEGGKLSIC